MYLFAMKSDRSEGRGRKTSVMVAAAMAAAVGCAAAVEAATLTNVTTGTVMFDTGWETGTAGSSTGGTPGGDVSTDTPLVGTISSPVGGNTSGDAWIFTDYTYSGTNVKAYTGDKFVATIRRNPGGGDGALRGVSSDTVSSDEGDTISLAVAFYRGAGNGKIALYNDQGDTLVWLNLLANSDVVAWTGAAEDTGLDYTQNEWNTLVVEYVNGADTASVSLNGGSSVSFTTNGAGNVHSFQLQNNGGGSDIPFYWDNVIPEPGSLLLLSAGAPLILLRRAGRP